MNSLSFLSESSSSSLSFLKDDKSSLSFLLEEEAIATHKDKLHNNHPRTSDRYVGESDYITPSQCIPDCKLKIRESGGNNSELWCGPAYKDKDKPWYHFHDTNEEYVNFTCDAGHEQSIRVDHSCWCGWTTSSSSSSSSMDLRPDKPLKKVTKKKKKKVPTTDEDLEHSSGAEDRIKIVKSKPRQRVLSRPAERRQPLPLVPSAPLYSVPATDLPRIVDVEELKLRYPSISSNQARKPQLASSPPQSSSSVTLYERAEQSVAGQDHKEYPLRGPPLASHEIMQSIHDQTTNYSFIREGKLSHTAIEEIPKLISDRAIIVPESLAEHESRMLGAAGRWLHKESGRYLEWPPCKRGEGMPLDTKRPPSDNKQSPPEEEVGCYGFIERSIQPLASPRHVLTQMLTSTEYDTFIRTGVHPGIPRNCFLCERMYIQHMVLSHQGGNYPSEQNQIIQCYQNRENQLGGYRDCMILRPNLNHKGLVGPIAIIRTNLLQRFIDPSNGRPMISQRAGIYEAAPMVRAQIGDTLS